MPPVGLTHFEYWGARATPSEIGDTLPRPGGQAIYLVATSAIPLGYLVAQDLTTDMQIVTAPASSVNVLGVCVGYRGLDGFDHFDAGPAAGMTAIVQISGIVSCYADSAVTRGDRLVSGSTTAGRVATAAALSATIANATIPAGATGVTSTAANGAIVTVPNPVFAGNGANLTSIVGKALQSAAAAGDSVLVLLS